MSKKRNKNKVSNGIKDDQLESLKSLKEELKVKEEPKPVEKPRETVLYNDVTNPRFKCKEVHRDVLIPITVMKENGIRKNEEILEKNKEQNLGVYIKLETKDLLKQFVEYQVNQVVLLLDNLNDQLRYVEMILNDIRHIIENETFNAAQGYDLAKSMQIVLRHRRNIKDDIEKLETMKKSLINETVNVVDLNRSLMVKEANQKAERNTMDSYKFRVLEGADIRIRHIRSMVDELLSEGVDPEHV